MTGCVNFILNNHDEIIAVGGEWDYFALANGAPELIGENVSGRPLIEFISGNVTRQFVLAILHTVRSSAQAIELDYRCDSANERRFMRMQVSLDQSGDIHFLNTTLRTETRQHNVFISRAAQRSKNTSTRCSMCNLIKSLNDWIEPDSPGTAIHPETSELLVIYGICTSCSDKLQRASPAQKLNAC